MNRIVREHYPVSKLPEELRRQVEGRQRVTLTLAWEEDFDSGQPRQLKTLEELFGLGMPTFKSLDAVAAHVRSLRDH